MPQSAMIPAKKGNAHTSDGIWPVKLVLEMSNSLRLDKFANSVGIVPSKEGLSMSFKYCKLDISAKYAGTVPVNRLPSKLSNRKFVKDCANAALGTTVATFPGKAQSTMLNSSNLVKKAISGGILPTKVWSFKRPKNSISPSKLQGEVWMDAHSH